MPIERPTLGVERFIQRGLATAGGRRIGGRGAKPGATYRAGWARGLTQDQATEKARSMYAGLGDGVRAKYEAQAGLADVVSQRERESGPLAASQAGEGVLGGGEAPHGRPVPPVPVRRVPLDAGRVERLPSVGGMADMPVSTGRRVIGEPVLPVERPRFRSGFDDEEPSLSLMDRMRERQRRAAARGV